MRYRKPPWLGVVLFLGTNLIGACGFYSAEIMPQTFTARMDRSVPLPDEVDFVRVKERVPVYTGPGTDYLLKGDLFKGDLVRVLAQNDDWYKTFSYRCRVGWIHHSDMEPR